MSTKISQKKYGERMIAPPISELGFCGLATGAAMAGLRPIVDLSTGSFIYEAWPQVANEAANAFSMSGGQTRVPVVFHLFHGLRGGGAAQHSGSPQAMLWNVPGLEIVIPSSPRDVKGLLKTAVASDNPTIFVDHTKLLDIRGEVPENDKPIPFGVADVKREGSDVTLIATSYTVQVVSQSRRETRQGRNRSRSRRSAHAGAVRSGDDSLFGGKDPSRRHRRRDPSELRRRRRDRRAHRRDRLRQTENPHPPRLDARRAGALQPAAGSAYRPIGVAHHGRRQRAAGSACE